MIIWMKSEMGVFKFYLSNRSSNSLLSSFILTSHNSFVEKTSPNRIYFPLYHFSIWNIWWATFVVAMPVRRTPGARSSGRTRLWAPPECPVGCFWWFCQCFWSCCRGFVLSCWRANVVTSCRGLVAFQCAVHCFLYFFLSFFVILFGGMGFFCIFALKKHWMCGLTLRVEHKMSPSGAYSFIPRVIEYRNRLWYIFPLGLVWSVSATFKKISCPFLFTAR